MTGKMKIMPLCERGTSTIQTPRYSHQGPAAQAEPAHPAELAAVPGRVGPGGAAPGVPRNMGFSFWRSRWSYRSIWVRLFGPGRVAVQSMYTPARGHRGHPPPLLRTTH